MPTELIALLALTGVYYIYRLFTFKTYSQRLIDLFDSLKIPYCRIGYGSVGDWDVQIYNEIYVERKELRIQHVSGEATFAINNNEEVDKLIDAIQRAKKDFNEAINNNKFC